MSQAMTNSEIEDVLSSIRRLVTQEVRPPADRLILTAEQRVSKPDQPAAPAIGPDEPAAASEGTGSAGAGDTLDVEPESVAAAESATTDLAPVPENDAAEGEDTLIDEAELAQLIGRLVREELHGQLGEKITLQVRKLVRAEIARALDERNLIG